MPATTLPGFEGLNPQAAAFIRQLMSGQLAPGTSGAINDDAATQASASGMPGTNRIGGSIFGNRRLRDIGRTSEQQQQQGFDNYLNTFGTAQLTAGQDVANRQNNYENWFRERGYQDSVRNAQEKLNENRLNNAPRENSSRVVSSPAGSIASRYRRFV